MKVGFGVTLGEFQYCKLPNTNTKVGNKFDRNEHFIKGVIDIQRGELEKIYDLKKESCKCLLKSKNLTEEGAEPYDSSTFNSHKSYSERLKDKKRKSDGINQGSIYRNCELITRSAAVVDRIWPNADCIMTKRRLATA